MLKEILAISGKPGLYKLISQGRNSRLIVEEITPAKKRISIQATEHVISLGDIAMYRQDTEEPLTNILATIYAKEDGKIISMDAKKASSAELEQFFADILPDFDRERVYASDIKKLIIWYNLLVVAGYTDFASPVWEESAAAEADPAK